MTWRRWTATGLAVVIVSGGVLTFVGHRSGPRPVAPADSTVSMVFPGCPAGYTRAAFGSEPSRATAAKVFTRDRTPSGGWVDVYTGIPAARAVLSADHVLSLHEAWCYGASSWSSAVRRRFARDLRNLVTVTAATNSSKADRGPAVWAPATPAGRCAIVAAWDYDLAHYVLHLPPTDLATITAWRPACG